MIKVTKEYGDDEWPACNGFVAEQDGTLTVNRYGEIFAVYNAAQWMKVWDGRAETVTTSVITSSHTLKMVREALCFMRSEADGDPVPTGSQVEMYDRILQDLIADIDRQRPLGPDGKHGDRHTALCQCEDVAPPATEG